MYLAENTLQAASVEFVYLGEQILRVADCKSLAEKAEGLFRQAQTGRNILPCFHLYIRKVLSLVELVVKALVLQQLFMGSLFGDPAFVDHQDHIRLPDGG